AVLNSADNTVTILLSNPHNPGTFMDNMGNPCGLPALAPPTPSPNPCPTYLTGRNPVAITVGKFNTNNDSELDLVIADENDNDLTVLIGHGNGTFTEKPGPCVSPGCSIGVAPIAVAAGPFNNPMSTPTAKQTGLFVLNQHDSQCFRPAQNNSYLASL